jgi:D-beta-D-heptose 7-phosphate kinase/D-beta-D-heptose 1-phosphate adenosyltransferase
VLADHIRGFQDLHAVVLGDSMLDRYVLGTTNRVSAEAPIPVIAKSGETLCPGGAANVAANLAALGSQVDFISVVGDDQPGHELTELLNGLGVHSAFLMVEPQLATIHKLRIVVGGQCVARCDDGIRAQLSQPTEVLLLEALEHAAEQADLIVISDYGYGAVSERVLRRVAAIRSVHPLPLLVDAKDLLRYRNASASVLTPNLKEALESVALAGALPDEPDDSELETIGRSVLAMTDAERVAITLAADGAFLVTRDGSARRLPARRVASLSDVGGGDSFLAAMALSSAAGGSFELAAGIGLEAAAISVSKPLTAVVSARELISQVVVPERRDFSLTAAELVIQPVRDSGKRIVFTNGVFDILHAGHVDLLRRARRLGDYLVVGVNSDASARRLKGRGRPINSEQDRAAMVAALDPVDLVVLFDEDEPSNLILHIRPSLHIKGGDYGSADQLAEQHAVRRVGGRVVILPLAGHHSTSDVIDRIRSLQPDDLVVSVTA